MRRHLAEAAVLAGLCAAFAVAQAGSLDDPYFGDAQYYVAPSARDVYLDPSDPIPKGPWDNGHPPLFFWALAALWTIFGPHLWVSHAAVLVGAVAAIVLTFFLGRILFGPVAGLFAATLLAVHPVFFFTSSTVTIDIPLLAFTLLCVIAAIRGRWALAVASGCVMVLTKETAVIFLPAIAIGAAFLTPEEGRPGWNRPAALVAVPSLALGAWLVAHRLAVGWWIYIDESRTAKFAPGDLPGFPYLYEVYRRSLEQVILAHGQWAGVLLIVLALVLDLVARKQRPMPRTGWTLAVVWLGVLLPLGAFLGLIKLYLPRYYLFAIALFCIVVGWVASRAGRAAPFLAAAVAVSFFAAHQETWRPGWETNRGFTDVLTLHTRAARHLEREHPDARVLTNWPHWANLCDPFYGYVTRPLRVVALLHGKEWGSFCAPGTFSAAPEDRLTADDFDLLYVGPIVAAKGRRLGVDEHVGLHEVDRLEQGGYQVVLYAPRPQDRAPRFHPSVSP